MTYSIFQEQKSKEEQDRLHQQLLAREATVAHEKETVAAMFAEIEELSRDLEAKNEQMMVIQNETHDYIT